MLLEAARAGHPFDLVLLEDKMPETGVEQVAAAIHGTAILKGTHIIVQSSAGEPANSRILDGLGISAYLVKPVKSSVLLEAIAAAISSDETATQLTPEPAAPMPSPPSPRLLPAAEHACAADYKTQILIAEDNVINQRVLEALLTPESVKITFAGNGKEAFDLARQNTFDMILMDISMPVMDGYDATKAIRAHEAKNNLVRTPIVGLSAHVLEKNRVKAIEADMDDYLSKPVRRADMVAAIAQWGFVKQYRPEEEPGAEKSASNKVA